MRKVVVTGIGVVSPLGIGLEVNWEAVLAGKSGIGPITLFDASQHKTQFAGEVKDFNPADYMDPKEVKRNDRFLHFTMAAAREAVIQAGLDQGAPDPERVACMVGVGIGGMDSLETQCRRLFDKGPSRVSPFLIPQMITDTSSGMVSIAYGFKGPNFDITSACASGAHSIGESCWAIRAGRSDVVVAGGFEAAVTPLGVAGFNALKALSTRNDDPLHASRPFDGERDGFVIAEGGAIVILEEREHARKRGIEILAEVTGYGATGDAFHVTAPSEDGDGIARAMRIALQDAELNPDDIGYVNAHGTSTKYNDLTETIALKNVFGDHAGRMPVSSTKSMTGHMLGGTGAVELAFAINAIARGVVPPTINYECPDPDCDLDYVPNTAREVSVKHAMTNSLGFGGHNASLIVSAV